MEELTFFDHHVYLTLLIFINLFSKFKKRFVEYLCTQHVPPRTPPKACCASYRTERNSEFIAQVRQNIVLEIFQGDISHFTPPWKYSD